MIRTSTVDLTVIEAIAYRRKLAGSDIGIVIHRPGEKQPGIASISKKTGEAIISANTPKNKYPEEAFAEAIALTRGMPYRNLSTIKYVLPKEEEVEEKPEEVVVVDSKDYTTIINMYTDKNDKLSYDLLSKDMIKFAHQSSKVREMIAEKKSVAEIRKYAVGVKFRNITDNHDLTDGQIDKIVEMLDEVSPKGVFKEFNEEIKNQLKK